MSKIKQILIDSKQKVAGAVATGAMVVGTSAFAAVDVGVTTALSDAKTDVGAVGAAVLIAIVAAATFKYIRRAL